MKFKCTNSVLEDSFVIEADTMEEIREIAIKETSKRGWQIEDCYSEAV